MSCRDLPRPAELRALLAVAQRLVGDEESAHGRDHGERDERRHRECHGRQRDEHENGSRAAVSEPAAYAQPQEDVREHPVYERIIMRSDPQSLD